MSLYLLIAKIERKRKLKSIKILKNRILEFKKF